MHDEGLVVAEVDQADDAVLDDLLQLHENSGPPDLLGTIGAASSA